MMRPMMADKDIQDIIAYLRSGDPAVAAADTTVGKTHINFLGRTGIRLITHPQPYQKVIARPDSNDPVAYGKYLVAIVGCYHCHSKKVMGLNYLEPEQSNGYLQGGIRLKDPTGNRLRGPNLTPDKETGIGNFSETTFTRAVREGIAPSGKKLSPPMPRFTRMTDQQIAAIYKYLQHLSPVHHIVIGQEH